MANKHTEVEEICFDFYSLLYKGQPILEETLAEVLDEFQGSFNEDTNEELTKPFSALEFFKAIKVMVDGKALGHDGIPLGFFKKCWKFISDEFTSMILQALEHEEFHPGMTKGVIFLIPKEGDQF